MEPNLDPGQLVGSTQLLTQIMSGLRHRYASLNGVTTRQDGRTVGFTAAAITNIRH
jgi:hypothetical protein